MKHHTTNTAVRKTSDLIGPALDLAVWRAGNKDKDQEIFFIGHTDYGMYHYSTDWAYGGPLIEREEIGIRRNAPCSEGREWEALPSITAKGAGGMYAYGPTPLVAAMRLYVASKLGEYVDIPESLLWEEKK